MDQKTEDDEGLKDYLFKRNCADIAADSVEDEIRAMQSFTPEEAQDLIARYMFYSFERWLHVVNRQSNQPEVTGGYKEALDDTRGDLGLMQGAIQKMFRGDYSGVRSYYQQKLDDGDYGGTDTRYVEFADKLEVLLKVLPDSGNAQTPLTPAWQDPRFNV